MSDRNGGTGVPRKSRRLRNGHFDPRGIAVQALVMGLAAAAYFLVRGAMETAESQALRNAERIISLERTLGFFWEPTWQSWIEGSDLLVTLVNWVYIYGHWPVILAVAFWLAWFHPAQYRLMRNAFLISGAIGLVIFLAFPTAPPRLTDLDVVDTVTERSNAYRVLQPPGFTNQYAAVPSLHFGWNLLIGISVFRCAHAWPVRTFGVVLPIAMFFAIVLTANHWIFDAIAGAAVALAGLGIAYGFANRARLRQVIARRGRQEQPTGV